MKKILFLQFLSGDDSVCNFLKHHAIVLFSEKITIKIVQGIETS